MSLDPNSEIPYRELPNQDPPKKPKEGLSAFAHIFLVILAAYFILKVFVFDHKVSLDENLRIHLSDQVSHYNSTLREVTVSATATARFLKEEYISRETSMDLAFVIDFPEAREASKREIIQAAIKETLPFLGDKDRLSNFIFDEEFPDVLSYIPLTNTTEGNKNTVFSNPGEEISVTTKSIQATSQGLRAAVKFLNERKKVNRVTGIMIYTTQCDLQEINETLQELKSHHAFLFCSHPGNEFPLSIEKEKAFDMNEGTFRNIFTEYLQHAVFGIVKFSVEARLYDLDVKIATREFEEQPFSRYGMLVSKSLSIIEKGQKNLLIDVKFPIPNLEIWEIPPELAELDVPIAHIKMAFTDVDGNRVWKNQELMFDVLKYK